MQDLDWSDLRHLMALGRAGSLGRAARSLGVDATTVARRIRALERAAGAALVHRGEGGAQQLTPLGSEIAGRAEAMAAEADGIADLLGRARGRLAGTVRVTAVPILVNRVLVPALPALLARHPDLTVELVPEARDLSLTRREADLALRLGRPDSGGAAVRMRRIAQLAHAPYGPAGGPPGLPWIGYDAAMAHRPHARWLARAAARDGVAGLRVADAETALAGVAAGLGRSLLPVAAARDAAGLARLPDGPEPPPERPVWLLSHAGLGGLPSHRAVADWLAGEALASRSAPGTP